MLESRKREWIERPMSIAPPPNLAKMIFNERVQRFRKDHLEFDEFLSELGQLLTKEENEDFYNIIRFINGDAETNWICTRMSLFDISLKLYNLCLSPSQALEYIKRCHEIYKKMNSCKYNMAKFFFVREQERVEVTISPDESVFGHPSFDFLIRINNYDWKHALYYSRTTVMRADKEIYEDTLKLFEYFQELKLIRNITHKAIGELKKYKVITIAKDKNELEIIKLPVGQYDFSKL